MYKKVLFPERSLGNRELKMYAVITNLRKYVDGGIAEDIKFYGSVDGALDETKSIWKSGECLLVEVSVPENNNLDLSSNEVVNTFQYLHNNILKGYELLEGFRPEQTGKTLDDIVLDKYLEIYDSNEEIISASRIITGDIHPYRDSQLVFGTKTVYCLIRPNKIKSGHVRYYEIVHEKDEQGQWRTLIVQSDRL